MKLICCGINHQTASVAEREYFTFSEATLLPALRNLQAAFNGQEALIVSTCNRLEVYAVAESAAEISQWLANYFRVDHSELTELLYIKQDLMAVQHAIRVASGLDSMILGEPQILGQMKCAYAQAGELGLVGQQLGHVFPFVFSTAKKIRTETTLGQYPVSIAYIAVMLAKQFIAAIDRAKILLIGAGETIELVAEHLHQVGAQHMLVANRTVEKAQRVVEKFEAQPIILSDIPHYIEDVDIIITSTASQLPLIGKGLIERIMKARTERPLFIVDLAVPRDVEAEVAEISNVHLYNIDDLQHVVAENKKQRQKAADQAEQIVSEELKNFQRWCASLESVPMVCAYRQHVEQLRDIELQKALNNLAQGKSAEQALQELARNLTNKLMHNPSIEMRKASSEGRSDILQWSKQLLLGIQANETIN